MGFREVAEELHRLAAERARREGPGLEYWLVHSVNPIVLDPLGSSEGRLEQGERGFEVSRAVIGKVEPGDTALVARLPGGDRAFVAALGPTAFSGGASVEFDSPIALSAGVSIAEGTEETAARSDHRHGVPTAAPVSVVLDGANDEGTSSSLARADHVHGLAAAAPGTISPDDSAAEGSSSAVARADHRHAIATATAGAITGTAAEGSSSSFARADHDHSYAAGSIPGSALEGGTTTKVIRSPHTWAVQGEIKVPSGDTDYIPGFFIAEPGAQTVKVVAARYKINSGTSATVKIQKNGVDLTGFTAISVGTTAADTNPADQDVADGDYITLVVTAVSGAPKNLSFSLLLETTV